MGIYRHFPYSNFHEMNLDEIIKIMREMQDEWDATKAEWASYKDFIDNYFANLDVTNEVLHAMRVLASTGELNDIIDPTIATATSTWLAEHITVTEGTTVIDDTLTIAGAGADAKTVGDKFTEYKEELTDITGDTVYHYRRGCYIALNGTTADVTNYVTSDTYECVVVPCTEGDVFRVNAQGQNATRPWGFVDANGTVLKVAISNTKIENDTVIAPANSAWFVSNNQFVNNPNSLVVKGMQVVPHEKTTDYIHSVLFETFNIDPKSYEYSLTFEQGGFSSGGANNDLISRIRTKIIDLTLFKRITIKPETGYQYYYILYNASKDILVHSEWLGDELTINFANAKYIRLQARHVQDATEINPSEGENIHLYGHFLLTNGSPVNKWYILGDSISAGYYSMTQSEAEAMGKTLDYVSPVTTEGGEVTGSIWDSTLNHNYWGYINEWYLHRTLVKWGIPGQGFIHVANLNSKNGVNMVHDNDFSDAGLITVAWGFNDWHYNMNRGTTNLIDSNIPIPTDDFDISRITTINGAIWYCLGMLIKKAPNAKILVQTPINGWAYGGDFDSKWSIETSKSHSGTLRNIHDDIIYWCNYYGLEYIDLTYNNSVVNLVNIKDTIVDGSHPSDATHKQLARSIHDKVGY